MKYRAIAIMLIMSVAIGTGIGFLISWGVR